MGEHTISFKVSDEEKDRLDKKIAELEYKGHLPSGVSRSDVMRKLIKNWLKQNGDLLENGDTTNTE